MMKCTQCGNEYEGNFCPNCGASENPTSAPSKDVQYVRWSGSGKDYVEETHITTTLEWFGWVLLTLFMPLIGAIIMFCCAPGKSAKNYARLQLILYILVVVLGIVGVILAILVPSTLGYINKR